MVVKSLDTGKPLIAVECDGAAYHGTLEDFAWDAYRQSILEEHGFVFHRIWGRDWWDNPDREIRKLVDFISKVDTRSQKHNLKPSYVSEHIDLVQVNSDSMEKSLGEERVVCKKKTEFDLKSSKKSKPNSTSGDGAQKSFGFKK